MPVDPDKFLSAAAFLCQDAIIEKDTNILSAIKLMDRLDIDLPASLPANATFVIPIKTTVVVTFKSPIPRRFTAHIIGRRPDKSEFASGAYSLELTGGAHGHTLLMPVRFESTSAGIYWFEVWVEGDVLQRIPLEVRHTATAQSESPSQTESPSSS